MRFLLAILLLLPWPGWVLRAQDLTGQWTGSATNNLSDKKQKLVLSIASGDSSFGGILHWYVPETHTIRHLIVSGRYYGRDSILSIREDSVRGDRVMTPWAEAEGETVNGTGSTGGENSRANGTGTPGSADGTGRADGMAGSGDGVNAGPGRARSFYILYYKRIGHKEVLEGNWREPAGSGQKGGDLVIRLEKKAPPFIPIVVTTHKKKDSAQLKQYQALLTRQTFIAATIPVRGIDSIKIDLYDNGEIDGDSVSLYLNNELLIGHLKLTASPKTLLLPIDRSLPVNKLVLFAENLGRLPPNTALMQVTINGKLYNLFLSTDYKRNAMVEFTLQE